MTDNENDKGGLGVIYSRDYVMGLLTKIEAMSKERDELKNALVFYANHWTYEPFEDKAEPEIYYDRGQKARDVLLKIQGDANAKP